MPLTRPPMVYEEPREPLIVPPEFGMLTTPPPVLKLKSTDPLIDPERTRVTPWLIENWACTLYRVIVIRVPDTV